jgi:hypothetical protein
VTSRITGRPWPSQTAGSCAFSPPLLRPMQREKAPCLSRPAAVRCALRCLASIVSRDSGPVSPPGLRRCGRTRPCGSSGQSGRGASCAGHRQTVRRATAGRGGSVDDPAQHAAIVHPRDTARAKRTG